MSELPKSRYQVKINFIRKICPYQDHFCNGEHVPDISPISLVDRCRIPDIEPCKYFDLTLRCCTHANYPKRRYKKGEKNICQEK